jgi:hypothetical protein
MKRLFVLVGLVAAACALEAQSPTLIMTADIPFDFQLGPNAMPSGHYRVAYAQGLLILRCGNHAASVLTIPKERAKAPETALMEFTRYGDSYFFAGVWSPYMAQGSTVAKTKLEKEVASRAARGEPTTIALNGQ